MGGNPSNFKAWLTVTELFTMPAVISLLEKVSMRTVGGGAGWEIFKVYYLNLFQESRAALAFV